ncbi:hypothetical protein CVT24_011648 [Panaeolus cyanescens]|uniref:Rhodopsin domain-containing protein n=1 Tax=Panaeolus cyanescens TaxID=181874 RepID=A0A409YH26_9AGAR|nr:hypothetical protein CVT24_011648 [Panaeolus cyanescens]
MSDAPPISAGTVIMSLTAARALTGTAYVISFVTTFLRLYHRVTIHRFWWDDFWAAFALLSGMMSCIIWLAIERIMSSPSFSARYFGITGMFVCYTHSMWCSKISLAVTIVRLLGDGGARKVSKFVAYLFAVAGVTLIFQKAFICGFNFNRLPLCAIPVWTGYLELSVDISGDIWLVCAPLYILRNINLAGEHRRLLRAIFLCGTFVTAASIVRAVFIFTAQNLMMGILGHLQLAISLITCNLLVLVTFIYRKVSASSDGSDGFNTSSASVPQNDRPTMGHSILSIPQTPVTQDSSYSRITFTTLGSSMLCPLESNETAPTFEQGTEPANGSPPMVIRAVQGSS